MDKVMSRQQAATYVGMSSRNLNRLMVVRLVPFLKTFFRLNSQGRVFFSKKRLDEWMAKDEDLEAMTDLEKEAWKIEQNANIVAERSKEADEELLALQILKLSRTLRSCLDEGKEPNLSEEERRKLEEHSGDFEEYFALIPQLHELEKKRLVEFFGDETCLHYFPEIFQVEIEAGKRTNAGKPKEMHGGVPLERYESKPGTLKPKEEKIQVVQSQADEGRMTYHVDEDKE